VWISVIGANWQLVVEISEIRHHFLPVIANKKSINHRSRPTTRCSGWHSPARFREDGHGQSLQCRTAITRLGVGGLLPRQSLLPMDNLGANPPFKPSFRKPHRVAIIGIFPITGVGPDPRKLYIPIRADYFIIFDNRPNQFTLIV
jgi:hypothetical protein